MSLSRTAYIHFLRKSMIFEQVCKNVQETLSWDKLVCKDGLTQKKERIYIPVIKQAIEKYGGTIGQCAGSQQAMDFREVQMPGIDGTFDMDGKSTNQGFVFMFNDSVPKVDALYMFIQVQYKSVIVKKGRDIIEQIAETEQMTFDDVMAKLDHRQKRILEIKNFSIGNSDIRIESYARPSWSVKLPQEWFGVDPRKSKRDVIKEIEDFFSGSWPKKISHTARRYEHYCTKYDNLKKLITFLESLTPQSSESKEVEPHFQAEQLDLSVTPPSHSLSEIPESV